MQEVFPLEVAALKSLILRLIAVSTGVAIGGEESAINLPTVFRVPSGVRRFGCVK